MPVSLSPTPPNFQQLKINRVLNAPASMFNSLLNTWSANVLAIWNDPNPQAIITGLGTNAASVFSYSATLATFLESLTPGCTASTLAKVLPFTVNEDGTITINS